MTGTERPLVEMDVRNRVNRLGLPSQVASFVRLDILRRRLKPGDKIPTEQELSVLHGVSRAVIREAIAKLRHEGLVVVRQGVGAFVAPPDESRSLTLVPGTLAEPEDYRHLYELRLLMETGAAELAARNRTADDVRQFARCIDAMATATQVDAAYVEADMHFHSLIAGATKNPFVTLFISFVAGKLKESISVSLRRLEFRSTSRLTIQEHRAIQAAIVARDAAGAAAAMRLHLLGSARRLGLGL